MLTQQNYVFYLLNDVESGTLYKPDCRCEDSWM